ncbi:MAG TPA: ABC transporter ATP-binding protein [Methylomirabilota bacterium]|jgi:iron(III) transport system ATP-binding protein|nr:ABC transporter ATP-binding protein [Methylomirabilota bacterium]
MAGIEIRRLSKGYGGPPAVQDLSLEIGDNQFVTLLGPSGCGKTTTLRLLAGFLAPDAGEIRVGGRLLSSAAGVIPPEKRGMGMVFQNYAVWPHISVYDNVAFGLEVRKVPRAEARRRVGAVLELVNLAGLEARYPGQLSGGQQQRVALARSLVVEPSILLLDEPLSNLDAKLRERMRWELKELQRRTAITFVYVTHDQSEALALSDRIAVMYQGRLLQYGTPREVYAQPADRTVADFMGLVNLVPGRVVAVGDESAVALGGPHPVRLAIPPGLRDGQAVQVAIRPENVRLAADPPPGPGPGEALLPGRVVAATFLGNLTDYHVALDDGPRLRVQAHPLERFEVGQRVTLRLDTSQCAVFQ